MQAGFLRFTLPALAAVTLLLAGGGVAAQSRGESATPDAAEGGDAVFLVANRALRDVVYRETVLIAAPLPNGGHIGVIVNRPTERPLISLFPEHEPSRKVVDPVHYGGPFSRGALVALVKADSSPGNGAVPLMKSLYLAFGSTTIDRVIEQNPNEARYYVGYVGWRPGELNSELERGFWTVTGVDRDALFRKSAEMQNLWRELLDQSRRIQAQLGTKALN
ncbi:MAG: YqgE/AlgH family protein [Burkholderiales bacterium]|nr:YqgE/AlgH family protein [Burkholderiales bacterium]